LCAQKRGDAANSPLTINWQPGVVGRHKSEI
jgi:hypothetical protein